MSRFFEQTVVNPELFGYGIETLTRQLRSKAWEGAGERNPATAATAANPLILDLDATMVVSHSENETSPEPTWAATASPRSSPPVTMVPVTAPGNLRLPAAVRQRRGGQRR